MYFEGKTGSYIDLKQVEFHEFPMVSICFGYDYNVTKDACPSNYDTSVNFFSMNGKEAEPVSPDQWKKWWDLVTVDPKDVIESIKLQDGVTGDEIFNYKVAFPSKLDEAEINTFNSHQGKCISVKVNYI